MNGESEKTLGKRAAAAKFAAGEAGVNGQMAEAEPEADAVARAQAEAASKALAGLRIAVGVLFLIFGEYKVFGTQFTLDGGFQSWIERFLSGGAYPFMVPVLKDFVLPHGRAIAFLVAYGELAIGLGLVLGILARAASACGLAYMLALLFSSNYPGPHAPFWEYFGASLEHLVFALCFAAFLAGNPREPSLRTYLSRRKKTHTE